MKYASQPISAPIDDRRWFIEGTYEARRGGSANVVSPLLSQKDTMLR